MPNRSEILSKSFSADKKTPEMVDSGFLEFLKEQKKTERVLANSWTDRDILIPFLESSKDHES